MQRKVGLSVWVLAMMVGAAPSISFAKKSLNNHDYLQANAAPIEAAASDTMPSISLDGLPEALASLSRHGLDGDSYLLAYDALNMDDNAARNDFVRAVLLDLHYGAARSTKQSDEALNDALKACDGSLTECFQRVAARHPHYAMLQTMLGQYQAIEAQGGWPTIPAGASLKRGQSDARIAVLERRLMAEGHLNKATTQPAAVNYDEAIEAAIMRFQRLHGLTADGVAGRETINALNVPAAKRVQQIALSLERLRQLPDRASGAHVLVNIPSYSLTAYENGKQTLNMEVVVGQKSRPTPEFSNQITIVGINPTWTPTSTILNKDLLPKFRNNPSYANSGGFQITDRATGERLNPEFVDWHSVSARDVSVVQQSGNRNALGKVKFLLPDNQSIYLHDTSHPELFAKAMRALSSGCVRLSDPKAFLDFVVRAQASPEFAKLHEYYEGKSRKDVRLAQPISVQTTYFTAWIDDAGDIAFYDDVYGRDDGLELALSKQSKRIFAAR